ncbi:MAG: ATP-binding cassette domain-containing protein [Turicibacter sp.]|nr:ATP-binding cassette domain-containing protein [Turicibacter sp.]
MKLTVEGICKNFGEKEVLKDISFSISSGDALGYLGRNGAGKTTTIRILTDIFRADSGSVMLDGKPIDFNKIKMGYLPEERGLYQKSKIKDQMQYIGELRGMSARAAKDSALALLKELEADEHFNKKLETLSKGNQQKIQLAVALLHDPDIIILDEPFSGLDPVNAALLKKMIVKEVERGKLVLFSSHQMPYVEEFCEHICILNQGHIVVDGRIKEIKRAYPRNRILISPEIPPTDFLAELTAKYGEIWGKITSDTQIIASDMIVTLRNTQDKSRIFALMSEFDTVEQVRVVEPTLEEIFVEKAGDVLDNSDR